jgi:hypothetical protein
VAELIDNIETVGLLKKYYEGWHFLDRIIRDDDFKEPE